MRYRDLARRQFGVFARWQALDLGISGSTIERRLASGHVERLRRGVYRVAGAPESWEQDLMTACLWGGPQAVVSHRAAALLWSLDGVSAPQLEITVPFTHHDEAADVTVHRTRRMDDVDRRLRGGIPLTTPERTLVDLAAVLDEEHLEFALESALRMGLTYLPRLSRRIEQLGGRRGLRTLRRLVAIHQGAPAESALEVKVERFLREYGITGFIRQYEVWDGERRRRLDWAHPAKRVALEAMGWRWHGGRIAWSEDQIRDGNLAASGFRSIPVTDHALDQDRDALAARILRALDVAA